MVRDDRLRAIQRIIDTIEPPEHHEMISIQSVDRVPSCRTDVHRFANRWRYAKTQDTYWGTFSNYVPILATLKVGGASSRQYLALATVSADTAEGEKSLAPLVLNSE